MNVVFANKHVSYKKLDYIACWFMLATTYIDNSTAKFSFVSTNSLFQGEQVAIIWKELLKVVQIDFAYKSFMWSNNAQNNAGVAVVIVGMSDRRKSKRKKYIFNANNQGYCALSS